MPRYMLDTDMCSYVMKRSHPALVRKLRSVPIDSISVSVITKAELLFGVELSPRRSQDAAALDGFLKHVDVLEFDEAAAGHYAQIRADLQRRGEMIGANDLLIAAHARSRKDVLVTNNNREFGRVPGLKLANWAA